MKFFDWLFRRKPKETHFKVDVGNGPETKTWTEMQNLTQEELNYLFKDAKRCTSFNEDIGGWNVDSVTKMTDIISQEEIDAILNRK